MNPIRTLLLLSFALPLAGCPSGLEVSSVHPLDDAFVGLDHENAIARIVTFEGDRARTSDIALEEGEHQTAPRTAAREELVVLTEGVLGDEETEPVASAIHLIAPEGELGRWPLSTAYAELGVDPTGRYALALNPRGRIVVENRVEVVELDDPDGQPTALSLRSLGGEVPDAAAFSDGLAFPDGELRVAALLARGQATFFDLDAPEVSPITVPTTAEGNGTRIAEAIFVGDELLLRPTDGSQLIVVTLLPPAGERAQRFDVSIRTIGSQGQIHDVYVDERGDAPLVWMASSGKVEVVDLATGRQAEATTASGLASLLPYTGGAPGDATMRPRMLVHQSERSAVFFLALDPETLAFSEVSNVPLAFHPGSLVHDEAAGEVLFFDRHVDANGARTASERVPLAILDLDDQSVTPLSTSAVNHSSLDASGDLLWLADRQGYLNGFDLETRAQRELWIERDVQFLLPLPGASNRVLVFHDWQKGTFSVLTPETTADARPRRVSGVF